MRIGGVERDADRHRFAVPELMVGQPLQLVGRPVPEVERPRRAHLERIAGGRDVVQVQRGGAVDDLLHRRHVARRRAGAARSSMNSKNVWSLISAAFTASDSPPRQSRSESVRRNDESLTTANGGVKVPR